MKVKYLIFAGGLLPPQLSGDWMVFVRVGRWP